MYEYWIVCVKCGNRELMDSMRIELIDDIV